MNRRRLGVVAAIWIAVIGLAVGAWVVIGRPGATTPTVALAPPRYVDESTTAGLAHTYGGGRTTFTGGGVAVFDCDDDRLPDLYLAGGSKPAALYRNVGRPGAELEFMAVKDPATTPTGVLGAYPLDIDGDGHVDLAILRDDGAALLRGVGDCAFEPGDDRWSFSAATAATTAFSATWEGSAALPTLAFGKYVGTDAAGNSTYVCPDNELFRPNVAGSGYAPSIPLAPGFCSLSMLFSDWDGSGRRDLRVSNDRQYYDPELGQEQLWRIAAGEAPRLYSADDGWVFMQVWGMGIASHDLTGDGYPEVYLTSQGPNKLQTLLAGPDAPTYRDIAIKHGVVATRPSAGGDPLPSTAWHPEFQDVNNDGFIDLYVSKGNVGQQPDYAAVDPSDLFIGLPDGTFAYGAEEAGIVDPERGRGAALADFNADGLLDLVQVDLDAPVRLWRNVGAGTAGAPVAMGHWLGLEVRQPGPNPRAIGATLEVRIGEATQRRELTVGGGHAGGQLGWTHVGLGPATRADVRVTWPDGETGPWIGVNADRFVTIDRATGGLEPWLP
ncbi:MAG: CRTAC1 family protein [Candidatus Limnocylindrales bacterium]